MLVKYNGEVSRESRSYGCSKCGTGRSINGLETYKTVYRTYYSGRLYIFEKGKTYPVDDILGKYLTNLKYTDNNGVIKRQFEEVVDNTESTFVRNVEDTEFAIPKEEPTPKPVVEETPKPTEAPVENKPQPTEETHNSGNPLPTHEEHL